MDILEQFSVAFQAAPGATLIADPDGHIVFANHALVTLFGYERDQLIGCPVETLVPKDVRSTHPELREAYLHLPSSRTMGTGRDLYGVSKSGELIPVEIGLNHVTSNDATYVVASVLDITERKKEQEKTRLAIDAGASAMVMTDSSGVIVLANTQTFEMFGYASEELIGAAIEILIPESLRNKHGVYRTSYSANPSKRSMGRGRDLNGRRKDGAEFPVEIGLTPIDNHGERLIMATIIDISERKQAEAEINQKNLDLTRLNDELAQFAYSASHDLKAPLSSIEGLLTCIEEDIEEQDLDAVRENVIRAKKMSHRLKELIEDILGLAKAENLEEAFETVCISELLHETAGYVKALSSERLVTLDIQVSADLVANTQRTRIKQILDNLIHNSIKYADDNKTQRFVRVSADIHNDTLGLRIEDNGIGIPENRQQDVYKLFTRFGNHGQSGSGLGLALVKQHVDRLDGEIEFDSSTDGTTFTIRLPATARES